MSEGIIANKVIKYSNWDAVPDHLKTRTSLKKLGLKPSRGQQPSAIKTSSYYKTPDYDLFDMNVCVPVRKLSDSQKTSLEKARQESLKRRTCTECGYVEELGSHYRNKVYVRSGLCDRCQERQEHETMLEDDHATAVDWAKRMLDGLADSTIESHEIVILDSETTDLYGEIIDLAIIDLSGKVLYNHRFKPLSEIKSGAQAVHGLTAEMLAGESVFADEYLNIRTVLMQAKKVLIYNAEFDVTCLQHTARLHGCDLIPFNAECLMIWYAQYVGDWSDYHGDYRWQKLPDGDHTALGDCRASLAILKEMADVEKCSYRK